jgi:hypothetical protein
MLIQFAEWIMQMRNPEDQVLYDFFWILTFHMRDLSYEIP